MLSKGTAKKVTIYLNEDSQHHLGSLYEALLTFLLHKGVSGATVSRALAGFGAHRVMHTPKIEVLAEHEHRLRNAGQHVGEMAAIEPAQKRSADVVAHDTVVALRLTNPLFMSLGQTFPQIWLPIARELSRRICRKAGCSKWARPV
jgi:CRP-like cAMP-binding protein